MHRNESQTKNDNAENISLSDWQDAVALIAAALNTESQNTKGYQYAVIGSGAYVLHGTAYENPKDNPADIDITTTNPAITRKAILELQHSGAVSSIVEDTQSSLAVNKFQITFKNGKSFEFEFTHAEDFGFHSASLTTKNNIAVISLVETLQSIYLRPEHRIKDYMAYTSLIQSNLAVLPSLLNDAKLASPQFKKAVLTMVNILSDPIKSTNQDLVVGTVTKQLPRLVGTKAPKRQHQPEPSFPSQERAQPTAKQIQENQKRIEAATLQNRQNTTTTQTTNDVSSKIKPPKM